MPEKRLKVSGDLQELLEELMLDEDFCAEYDAILQQLDIEPPFEDAEPTCGAFNGAGRGAMIYMTGDTHGSFDMNKLRPKRWRVGQTLTRDDYLVVLGDFGAIQGNGSRKDPQLGKGDHRLLEWYEEQPWTTLFVDGNHENHDLIDSFAVTERFGGRVQVVPGYPHVIHLMRGEVYDIPVREGERVRCLVMGGADSIDKAYREEGVSWWAREMPSKEEYERCVASLEWVGWSVDYVFTHEVPFRAYPEVMDGARPYVRIEPTRNELAAFLDWVDDHIDKDRLKGWYAGHHHVDKTVLDGKHQVLYQQILELGQFTDQRG